MQIEAHAAAGWLVAELGKGNRRFRRLVLGAAVLPDLDALSYLFGYDAYGFYHHRITHTLLFSAFYSIFALSISKGCRLKTAIATQLAFATHILGDIFLTRYAVFLLYPFSNLKILYDGAVPLWHPLNKVVLLIGWTIMIWLSIRNKRTPLEALSVKLDQRVVSESQV